MTSHLPGWSCPRCEARNGEAISRCARCGNRRHADTPVTTIADVRVSEALDGARAIPSVVANESIADTLRRHLNEAIVVIAVKQNTLTAVLVTVSDDALGLWIQGSGVLRIPFTRLASVLEAVPSQELFIDGAHVAILVELQHAEVGSRASWFAGLDLPIDVPGSG